LEAVEDRGAKSAARPPKVIITSRRAAFQRAVDVQPNLRDLVVEIRQAVSYDEAKRREILQRYIEFFEPKWARDQSSGTVIIERVSEELLAPHNIYLFANRISEASPQTVQWGSRGEGLA
jgi:hypothetical protein